MKKTINTDQAPKAIGTYSQAVFAGDFLYVSGQIGMSAESAELVSSDFKDQTIQTFKNIQAILTEADLDFSNIIKMNVSLLDMQNFPILNEVMADFVSEPYPARAAVAVKQLPKGAEVEIEVIAHI